MLLQEAVKDSFAGSTYSPCVTIIRGAVKKFSEILCWRRMRDMIAHAVMWWWA